MTPPQPLATRRFELADQLAFAQLSGDANPMHVDPVAARRTQFGEPVVHGVHGLLWALDAVARSGVDLSSFRGLTAQFAKPILLGDQVEVFVASLDSGPKIEIRAQGLLCTTVRLSRDPPRVVEPFAPTQHEPAALRPLARDLSLDQITDAAGLLAYPCPDIASAFPAAAQALGPGVVEGLAGTTYIVGMEAPGLHSIYTKLVASLHPQDRHAKPHDARLAFRVAAVDARFRIIEIHAATAAIDAVMSTFARMPPVAPPALAAIRAHVKPDAFAGQRALIVGGSRGLGAATATILAAGGAAVAVTWTRGKAEAEALAADIGCATLTYDATRPPDGQIDLAALAPNAIYYFATGQIWRRRTRQFETDIMREFMRLHVEGFASLAEAARTAVKGRLALFYPSSAYAANAPKGFLEYGAAKRAGEAAAEHLAAHLPDLSVLIDRLPPIDTDQNASVTASQTLSPVDAMLPLVRRMHALIQA